MADLHVRLSALGGMSMAAHLGRAGVDVPVMWHTTYLRSSRIDIPLDCKLVELSQS